MTKSQTQHSPTAKAERLIEEGEAFMQLSGLQSGPPPGLAASQRERFDVVVIGGGQAGLSVGHYLARSGLRFVILEGAERIGDAWRKRWDSLRLFSPARFDGLVGMPFPAAAHYFPTKDEMGDYLESYAARFNLPVRTATKVQRVTRQQDGHYLVKAGELEIEAQHVVVAMASYQQRRVPAFASELRGDIVQLHSSEYRNPGQLAEGAVLLVGAGNSGSEIAMELARGRRVVMSGRDTGHIPFRIEGTVGRTLVPFIFRVIFHRVLTVKTPMGRKARPKFMSQGAPLIRVKPADLAAAGVERVGRMVGVKDGLPVLADGRVLDVANVVWCTGFHPGFSWIELPVFDKDGEPLHDGGVTVGEPGLYFVGLHFLYAASSTMIHGVGRDADRIVNTIVKRTRGARRPEQLQALQA
jgi:putative flavoprotein involved in K+ transport